MKLNELCKEIYNENLEKGFNVAEDNIGQVLMLIVSELSEALEADRKDKNANLNAFFESYHFELSKAQKNEGNVDEALIFKTLFEKYIKDTFQDEIADSIIRLFDFCGALIIDIETHIALKRKYNGLRPYKHDKKY